MKDETKMWLKYSEENLQSSIILLKSQLFNPCLQNIQQSVEKSLKALFVENSIHLKKTHSITELYNILLNHSLSITISNDDCDFLDSIYLPSKYPIGSVLPFYEPNAEICNKGISIEENALKCVYNILGL